MGVVEVEGSFKKPGAIPFKWETRPGVPKSDQPDPQPQYIHDHHHELELDDDHDHHDSSQSLPSTPHHLTPPPRTQSLRTPSSYLQWYDHDQDHDQESNPDPDPPLLTRPESTSAGRFLSSPRLSWKWGLKKLGSAKSKHKQELNNQVSKLENLAARWSVSARKSLSSLRGSLSTSSFSSSSHGSSP